MSFRLSPLLGLMCHVAEASYKVLSAIEVTLTLTHDAPGSRNLKSLFGPRVAHYIKYGAAEKRKRIKISAP